jgi:preprotein translocase subunit SecD
MAARRPRPGRQILLILLATLVMYAALAFNGVWSPKLGLDLRGGTRITLTASTETGEDVTTEKLEEAAGIIDSRVNATGVAESEVAVSGDNQIIVEIPGDARDDLVDSVKRQAQLRFRLVAGGPAPPQQPGQPGQGQQGQDESGQDESGQDESPDGAGEGEDTAPGNGRAAPFAQPRAAEGDEPDGGQGGQGDGRDDGQGAGQGGVPGAPAPGGRVTNESSTQELLAWMRNPDPRSVQRFTEFECTDETQVNDNPARPLVTCDEDGNKYLLSPAMIEGTQLTDASFGIPQGEASYAVTLDFDGEATDTFADVTRAMAGTGELFAIVLDGVVLSAPQVNSAITNGSAQITGDFTVAEAESLANSLKYGALPLSFQVPVETIEGPTLAGEQLSAGLWAAGVGMALVFLYAMLYYRALGSVVVASLLLAGALTFAAIIFLSETVGFTLTLPGIAGLIIGVGVTADSFIVLFERIRDEMREGKSMRVAVELGWDRAKMTCLISDAATLLAGIVLYIFAIGVVKGFAFALIITTLIDLAVYFWFTKPMMSWLVRYRFFSSGHRLSGLSPAQIGIEAIGKPRPVSLSGGVR